MSLARGAAEMFFRVRLSVLLTQKNNIRKRSHIIMLLVTVFAAANDAGKVSAEFAKSFAETEFEKFRITQDRLFRSDFDKLVRMVE